MVNRSFAEQSGDSPESGADSVLWKTYDDLKNMGFGTEEGSNGAVWNRVISSANWIPNGNITEDKVILGYTFYNGSRTMKTGTYKLTDYRAQNLQAKDFRDSNASASWAEWSKTNSSPEVWKDKRTGLYWSPDQGSMTNNFTISSCSFFSTSSKGDYSGEESGCGNAINACALLELDANGDGTKETNWYLPTQAEQLQAYLDGIYLATNPNWVTQGAFWASTENQYSGTYAWITALYQGYSNYSGKTSSSNVKCVRSD